MTIDVICPFCDKDKDKVREMAEQMKCKPFPSYFSFHFVDDRKDKAEPVDTMGIDCITYEGNKGTFHARKYGFEHTQSDYVWCVDVDDYIMPFVFTPDGADVVLYMWRKVAGGNGKEETTRVLEEGFIRPDSEWDKTRMVDEAFAHALWDKVVKRSVMASAYADLDFDEKCVVFEDLLLNALLFRHCSLLKKERKFIYVYKQERAWLVAEHKEATDFFLDQLPSDIKPYFVDKVRNDISFSKLEQDYRCSWRKSQIVTFALNRGCDRRCPYCNEDKDMKELSDDEIYENFDKCLARAERLHVMVGMEEGLYPQIKGGEPTLWSDSLVKRIQDRLSAYSSYMVFTNGSNKESLWYKDSRAVKMEHVIDWHGKKLEKSPNVLPIIVICHNEMEHLEEFCRINDGMEIVISACMHPNPEFNCTFNDIKEMARIEEKYNVCKNSIKFIERCKLGLDRAQANCRAACNGWEFDCVNMTASPCCVNGKRVPVEDFWGLEEVECGGCMWFC